MSLINTQVQDSEEVANNAAPLNVGNSLQDRNTVLCQAAFRRESWSGWCVDDVLALSAVLFNIVSAMFKIRSDLFKELSHKRQILRFNAYSLLFNMRLLLFNMRFLLLALLPLFFNFQSLLFPTRHRIPIHLDKMNLYLKRPPFILLHIQHPFYFMITRLLSAMNS